MRIFEIVKENVNLREAAELYGIPSRILSHRTMKLVGCCYEQSITDGNLSGFVIRWIFHLQMHRHHR